MGRAPPPGCLRARILGGMSETNHENQNTSGTGPEQETIGAGSAQNTSLERDPQEWTTGDEPMTDAQRSYLDTLAKEAGEELPADLTKAQASEHIDRLQKANPRAQG